MAYDVIISTPAQKSLDRLSIKDRRLADERILALAENPRPAGMIEMQGKRFRGLCRVRSGNFRIIYQIHDAKLHVLIVKVGDRREVYD